MSKAAITALLAVIHQTNPEDIIDRFEQAWEAIHDEPLVATAPSHNSALSWAEQYRKMIEVEAFESAAQILVWQIGKGPMGSFRWELTNMGYLDGEYQNAPGASIYHPLSLGGNPKTEAFFATPGMAMLIAALQAHELWGDEDSWLQ